MRTALNRAQAQTIVAPGIGSFVCFSRGGRSRRRFGLVEGRDRTWLCRSDRSRQDRPTRASLPAAPPSRAPARNRGQNRIDRSGDKTYATANASSSEILLYQGLLRQRRAVRRAGISGPGGGAQVLGFLRRAEARKRVERRHVVMPSGGGGAPSSSTRHACWTRAA